MKIKKWDNFLLKLIKISISKMWNFRTKKKTFVKSILNWYLVLALLLIYIIEDKRINESLLFIIKL